MGVGFYKNLYSTCIGNGTILVWGVGGHNPVGCATQTQCSVAA